MNPKPNQRYRNPLNLVSLLVWIAPLAFFGGMAIGYVDIRTRYIWDSYDIRDLETQIKDLKAETEMYELRIARLTNREQLEEYVKEDRRGLISVDPATRILLSTKGEVMNPRGTEEEEAIVQAVRRP